MTFDFESQLADIQGDLDRARTELAETQERLKSVSGSATSPDGTLDITLDSSGAVERVEVVGSRYRKMAPKELAALILDTIRAAADDHQAALLDALPESRIEGVSNEDLLNGNVDFVELLSEERTMPEIKFPATFDTSQTRDRARSTQQGGS